MSQTGNVRVRVNSGAEVGSQPRINIIGGGGTGVIAVNDDANSEVDITITAVGGVGADQDIFYPAPNPNDYKTRYASMRLDDDASTIVRQTFYLPTNWDGTWGVDVIVIPDGGGNLRWGVDTLMGAVCANEQFDTHNGTVALGVTAVTLDEIECLDITGALATALASDLVGLEFLRDGANAGDTVDAKVHYIGVILRAP